MTEPKTTYEEMTGSPDPDAAERRRAIEAIRPLYENKKAAALYELSAKRFDPSASDYAKFGPLRRWLHDHWGDPTKKQSERLYDDEHGYYAYLQSGGESVTYDAPTAIRDRDASLYKRLQELGCFEVSAERVADCIAKGLLMPIDVEPFRFVRIKSASLQVKEEKR